VEEVKLGSSPGRGRKKEKDKKKNKVKDSFQIIYFY
jgi:hypothetical protein